MIAEEDSVAVLLTIEATTNNGSEYQNIYALVFDLEDGLIARQIQIFDSRLTDGKFQLPASE